MNKSKSQSYKLSCHKLSIHDDDGEKKRKFRGIANSGKPFDTFFGDQAIIELSSVHHKEKVPTLLEHDFGQRVGVAQLSVVDDELVVNGSLLSNDDALSISADSDDGFPFEMSINISSTNVTELNKTQSEEVNGINYTGPLSILKDTKIGEVSFTVLGRDSETTAELLSKTGDKSMPKDNTKDDSLDGSKETNPSKESYTLSDINEIKNQLSELSDKLTQQTNINEMLVRDTRVKRVEILSHALSDKLTEEDNKILMSVNEETLSFIERHIAKQPPQTQLSNEFFQFKEEPLNNDSNPLMEEAERRYKESLNQHN